MNDTALATQTGSVDTALAVAQEQNGIMNAVGHEVQMIEGVDKGFRYQLPRLGKIHLGVKAPSGYPKATDYFVLPDELRTDEGFRDVLKALGEDPDKPRKLPIMLPCNSLGDNLRRSCDLYGSSKGLVCRSYDGVTCGRVNPQTGEIENMPCKRISGCSDYESKKCHWIHRLRVILPDAPGAGVWQIDTTSMNNFADLNIEMSGIKKMVNGKLGGIDLLLTLEEREFHVKMNGSSDLRPTKAWLMHIRTPLSMRRLREEAQNATAYDADVIEQFDDVTDDAPIYDEAEYFAEPETMAEETDELRASVKIQLVERFADNVIGMNKFICDTLQQKKITLPNCSYDQLKELEKNLRSE